VKQHMPNILGDLMTFHGSQFTIDGDMQLAPLAVAQPPESDIMNIDHAFNPTRCLHNLLYQSRIGSVHHTKPHLSGRTPYNHKNGNSNRETHQRVGQGEAQPDPNSPGQNGQRGYDWEGW